MIYLLTGHLEAKEMIVRCLSFINWAWL